MTKDGSDSAHTLKANFPTADTNFTMAPYHQSTQQGQEKCFAQYVTIFFAKGAKGDFHFDV